MTARWRHRRDTWNIWTQRANIHAAAAREHGFRLPPQRLPHLTIRTGPCCARSSAFGRATPAAILDKMNDFRAPPRQTAAQLPVEPARPSSAPRDISPESSSRSAGLKGASVGAAQVSARRLSHQPGRATCDDMLRLIELVQERVREQFGVELECEVRISKIIRRNPAETNTGKEDGIMYF
ncbi:MAG: hypothetical protein ACLR4Z_08745 [Butyricicoccaceae bacterium]